MKIGELIRDGKNQYSITLNQRIYTNVLLSYDDGSVDLDKFGEYYGILCDVTIIPYKNELRLLNERDILRFIVCCQPLNRFTHLLGDVVNAHAAMVMDLDINLDELYKERCDRASLFKCKTISITPNALEARIETIKKERSIFPQLQS